MLGDHCGDWTVAWSRRRAGEGDKGRAVGLASEPVSDAPELCGLGKVLTISEPDFLPL